MLIKVKLKDDEIVTRINGTLEEIARYYFPNKDVEEIEIIEGGELNENEYLKMTATLLYRASKKEVEEFQLTHNIRYCYKVEYKLEYREEYKDYKASAGLVNVA